MKPTTTTIRTPGHLKTTTKAWFAAVLAEYALEPHHVRLLTLAAEAWDRCCAARQILDRDGLTYLDRFDAPRARPEIAIERDSRIAFARLIRELGLDVSEPEAPRPPTIQGRGK